MTPCLTYTLALDKGLHWKFAQDINYYVAWNLENECLVFPMAIFLSFIDMCFDAFLGNGKASDWKQKIKKVLLLSTPIFTFYDTYMALNKILQDN